MLIHTYTHTCIYSYIHSYIYILIHTYTHTLLIHTYKVIDHTCEADELDPLEALACAQVGEASFSMVESLRGRRLVDFMCELKDDLERLKMDIISFQRRPMHIAKPLVGRQSFAFLSKDTNNSPGSSSKVGNNHPIMTEDDSASVLLHKVDDILHWLVPCVSVFSITLQSTYRRSFAVNETTEFVDYEFIYRMIHDEDNQSICSLAVIAGAESLIEVIMSSWEGVKSSSHILNDVIKGDNNSSVPGFNTSDVITLHELKAMGFDAKVRLFVCAFSSSSFFLFFFSFLFFHFLLVFTFYFIFFLSNNRSQALKEAGLDQSAIIHTGYSSTDLTKAGFAVEALRASGLDEATIRYCTYSYILIYTHTYSYVLIHIHTHSYMLVHTFLYN